MGLRPFQVSFSSWLLLGQNKQGYWYFVTIPSVECWEKIHITSQKYKDHTLAMVFSSQSIRSLNKKLLLLLSNSYLGDNGFTFDIIILGHFPKQASLRKPLYHQH